MIGKYLSLGLLLVSVGCAKPEYITPKNPSGGFEKAGSLTAELPNSKISVWLDWEARPTQNDFGSFVLKFGRPNLADGTSVLVDLRDDVSVVLWMPSMGHGSSPVKVEPVDIGTYRATKVFFTMPGDWDIRIQRKAEGVLVEEVAIPIRI